MKKGFTLIEMLMAVALTVVIGLLVAMAFSNTQKASQGAISTLQYELQGRAIMDLIARDVSNMYWVSGIDATAPQVETIYKANTTVPIFSYMYFKTSIPVQRTKSSSDVAKGYYPNDIVKVGWVFCSPPSTDYSTSTLLVAADKSFGDCYRPSPETALKPDSSDLYDGSINLYKVAITPDDVNYNDEISPSVKRVFCLYRAVSTPSDIDTVNKYGKDFLEADNYDIIDVSAGTGYTTPYMRSLDNMIAINDIRHVEFELVGNTHRDNQARGNYYAVRIRFSLTNAPADWNPSDDGWTEPEDYPNNTDGSPTQLDMKMLAQEDGYIWVNFERIIPIKQYP